VVGVSAQGASLGGGQFKFSHGRIIDPA